MGKSRKRDRSNTPEVAWESLPEAPSAHLAYIAAAQDAAKPQQPAKSHRQSSTAAAAAAAAAKASDAVDKAREIVDANSAMNGETARTAEREAWRALVTRLAALQGDRKIETFIADKHPELRGIAEACGAGVRRVSTMSKAKDAVGNWFERQLRGSNRQGPAARAAVCNRLVDVLRDHAAELCRNAGIEHVADVLEQGHRGEEGPLICSLLGQELVGSRYDGLFISRAGRGIFLFGDDDEHSRLPRVDQDGATVHAPIRTEVKVVKDKLVVAGFYHHDDEEFNPVKVPIGPFLTVYFEGVSLREANARWKSIDGDNIDGQALPNGVHNNVVSNTVVASSAAGNRHGEKDPSLKAIEASLPPGWELRESRSKKGVYYYANPAKGLSQLDRPKA